MNEQAEAAQVARWEAEAGGHEITNPVLRFVFLGLLGGAACGLLALALAGGL